MQLVPLIESLILKPADNVKIFSTDMKQGRYFTSVNTLQA